MSTSLQKSAGRSRGVQLEALWCLGPEFLASTKYRPEVQRRCVKNDGWTISLSLQDADFFFSATPLKFIMEPENQQMEKGDSELGSHHFQVPS